MSTFLTSQWKLRHLSTLSKLVSKGKKATSVMTGSTIGDDREKVYELRTYGIKPKDFKSYIDLTNQFIHLRTMHSKLIGFWTTELGMLNHAVHIWEYDSLDHRAKVRKELSTDVKWFDNYISKISPMLRFQDNLVMSLLPSCFIEIPTRLGVYELMRFSMAGTSRSPHKEYEAFIEAAKTIYSEQSSELIGCFDAEFGDNNTMICVWQHETFDAASLAKKELWRNPAVLGLPFTKRLKTSKTVGMLPLLVSPLQ